MTKTILSVFTLSMIACNGNDNLKKDNQIKEQTFLTECEKFINKITDCFNSSNTDTDCADITNKELNDLAEESRAENKTEKQGWKKELKHTMLLISVKCGSTNNDCIKQEVERQVKKIICVPRKKTEKGIGSLKKLWLSE